MSETLPHRFLIVGSGIAGSLLAWELLQVGCEVTVCSDSHNPGSSRIAAGLITPITGIRFVKTWNFDRVYGQCRSTYAALEKLFKEPVFRPLNILRLFKDQTESERWLRKSGLAEMAEFIVREWNEVPPLAGISHRGGGLEIRGGGWVDMTSLLKNLQGLMQKQIEWLDQSLDYQDLKISDSTISWQGKEFDRVIFCQGYRPENPWFDWLSWKPAQGEILTLRIPGLPSDRIINRGLFILPLGNDLFRCGSTYNWQHLKSTPAPEGRTKLESELRGLINLPHEIVEHSASIRPILKDTFPVIGLHPKHRTLGIFNGLGSKGALTAPFYARHFARYLIGEEALDPEVDIARNS